MDLLDNLKKHSEATAAEKRKKCIGLLEKQKRKFLCAIGKAEPTATLTGKDDDELVCFSEDFMSLNSLNWTDTIATNKVNEILKTHQNFELLLYLDCVEAIYSYYTYKERLTQSLEVYKAFTYVLTHARSFGNPAQNMFQHENKGSFQIKFRDILKPLPDSIYMRKITALIKDLRTGYDEMKYRILNVNVTYLTLLILRRFVRNETQFVDSFESDNTRDDYVKLCPHPLHSELPRISVVFNRYIKSHQLKPPVLLAIHAFVTGNDAKTKMILQGTCIQYLEWTGLQLPSLFFKVVRLYKIEEAQLWDALCLVKKTHESLHNLAKDYDAQHEMSRADPPETVSWFPYCRALDGNYHRKLSASENQEACMILAYLVDLKIGFEKSFVRNSFWAKNNCYKVRGLKEAEALYKQHPFA